MSGLSDFRCDEADGVSFPTPREVGASLSKHRETVLRVRDVRRSFGGTKVLDGISVELQRGDVVLLRGGNGSGKTTFLNILTGSLEADSGSIEVLSDRGGEHFAFPRAWWRAIDFSDHFTPERVARSGVSRTWQEIRLFASQNLQDNVALATPRQRGENPLSVLFCGPAITRERQQIDGQVAALLKRFGLGGRELSRADQVSLGQSKRVAIARSIQAGGRILFLDEPLAGLDGPGIQEVVRFLSELVVGGQVTLVIVEHVFNIPLIAHLVGVVWTLADGKLTVERPEHALKEAAAKSDSDLLRWLQRAAGPHARLRHVELPNGANLSIADPQPSDPARACAFEVKDLVVGRGRTPIVGRVSDDGTSQGLSFALREGSLAVLQAPNGWGKTTLLEALAGFIPVQQGVIAIDGRPVQQEATWTRVRRGLSILQSRYHGFDNLSVGESLQLSRAQASEGEFASLLKRRSSDLSGGQRQRLAVASALADPKARIRILDEPFSMLDALTIEHVRTMIASRNTGATLILVPAAHER